MSSSFAERVGAVDALEALDQQGAAIVRGLLSPEQCAATVALYGDESRFRSKVVMQRHGYGRGEYRYFDYPLPDLVGVLREQLYPVLAPLANRWHEALGLDARFPPALPEFLERCHAAGQGRPTPLLLRYEAGG